MEKCFCCIMDFFPCGKLYTLVARSAVLDCYSFGIQRRCVTKHSFKTVLVDFQI